MGFRRCVQAGRSILLGILVSTGLTKTLSGAAPPLVSVSTSTAHIPAGVSVSTQTWRTLPNASFLAGEDLLYVVRWGIITGGHSTLAVRAIENINGRPAYHIVSEANSSGIV